MALLEICLFAVLALGQIVLYVRLSPLQTLQDERTARQRAQGRSRDAVVTEGQALLNGLRNQYKDSAEIVRHERSISLALCDQLNAERVASQSLCAQLNAARVASEEFCLQLSAECVDLLDTLYRAFGPARVDQAVEEIQARRARGESKSAQVEKPAALGEEEQTRREGLPTRPATPAGEHAAPVRQDRAQTEELAAPAGEEQMQSAHSTTLPTTPEALAEQRELVATTAVEDADAEGDEATRAMSSSAVAEALQAAAGDAEEGENDPTLSLSSDAVDTALEAGAGGTTRAPQTSLRAVRAVAVAPPASAPSPLSPEPAWRAAGLLGRTRNAPVATPPSPPRSGTLVGMPRVSASAPAAGDAEEGIASPTARPGGMVHSIHARGGNAPPASAPRVAKTLLSMSAQSLVPTAAPCDTARPPPEPDDPSATFVSLPRFDPEHATTDGEPPWTLDLDPPLYAPRGRTTDEPRQGLDGVPEADPGRRLEPSEETPRRPRGVEHEARK